MMRTALVAGLSGALIAVGMADAAVAADAPAPAAPSPAAPSHIPGAHTPGDPFEPLNRQLYRLHKGLDHTIVRPIALGYQAIVPAPARRGIRNALDNLGEPVTFLNDVLQLKPKRAGTTLARFTINSTLGVGGLFDVAGKMNLPIHYEDFGQTLGRWGVGSGPYLFIPLLGPSNLRDGVGRVADWETNPLAIPSWNVSDEARLGITVLDSVDYRASLDGEIMNVERTATDDYATVRSAYGQNRKSEIADGAAPADDLPDFDTPAAPAAGQPDAPPPPPETPPPSTESDLP